MNQKDKIDFESPEGRRIYHNAMRQIFKFTGKERLMSEVTEELKKNCMTIGELKKQIQDMPEDYEIYIKMAWKDSDELFCLHGLELLGRYKLLLLVHIGKEDRL